MKTVLGLICGALLLIGASSSARASGWGYVCHVGDYPAASFGYGDYGAVQVSITSGVNCSGTYVGGGYLCSSNALSTGSCASSSYWRNEAQLMSLDASLQRAAAVNQQVYLYTDTNNNPTTIWFYAVGF